MAKISISDGKLRGFMKQGHHSRRMVGLEGMAVGLDLAMEVEVVEEMGIIWGTK